MSDAPISRRESLKRAAGALALGLGAPALLADAAEASSEVAVSGYKLSFNEGKHFDRMRTIASVELPDEVARLLMEPDAFNYMKLGDIRGERSVTFEVRRRG